MNGGSRRKPCGRQPGGADDEHQARGVVGDLVRYGAEEKSLDPGHALVADHDDAGLAFLGDSQDGLCRVAFLSEGSHGDVGLSERVHGRGENPLGLGPLGGSPGFGCGHVAGLFPEFRVGEAGNAVRISSLALRLVARSAASDTARVAASDPSAPTRINSVMGGLSFYLGGVASVAGAPGRGGSVEIEVLPEGGVLDAQLVPVAGGRFLSSGLNRWEVAMGETVGVGTGGPGRLLEDQRVAFFSGMTGTILALIVLTTLVDPISTAVCGVLRSATHSLLTTRSPNLLTCLPGHRPDLLFDGRPGLGLVQAELLL